MDQWCEAGCLDNICQRCPVFLLILHVNPTVVSRSFLLSHLQRLKYLSVSVQNVKAYYFQLLWPFYMFEPPTRIFIYSSSSHQSLSCSAQWDCDELSKCIWSVTIRVRHEWKIMNWTVTTHSVSTSLQCHLTMNQCYKVFVTIHLHKRFKHKYIYV